MPALAGLIGPGAAVNGLRQSLAIARGANPRATPSPGSFDQHLDLALRSGIGSGSDAQNIDPPLSIEAMRADQQTSLAEFEDRLRRLMREHGIELGDGIVLTANEQGLITVSGEHPQKSAVEQLFRDNPDLQTQFVQLTRQATVLRAADLSGELARLQADSPDDAAQQVSQLIRSSAQGKFSLTIRPADIVADFR
jgi:hypothetical protein